MEGTLSGVLCFTDLVYLYSGYLCTAAITTPASATNTRQWLFKPNTTAADTVKTFTLEKGTSARAERVPFATINSLTHTWTQEEASLSGGFFGQECAESVTITPGPTDLTALPVDPLSVSVYVGTATGTSEVQTITKGSHTAGQFKLTYEGQTTVDIAFNATGATITTALEALTTIGTGNVSVAGAASGPWTATFQGSMAGIDASLIVMTAGTTPLSGGTGEGVSQTTPAGLTKLLRCHRVEVNLPERFLQGMTLDSNEPSYSYIVEQGVEPTATIVLQHDSVSAAYMANLRAADTLFCRIIARGPIVETGFAHRLQLTFPFKFTDNDRGDEDGVYSSTYELSMVYNSTFAGWIEAIVHNSLTAL